MTKKEKIEEKLSIEDIREYFVDPDDVESGKRLADVAHQTIMVMAEIYATGGELKNLSKETQNWLSDLEDGEDELLRVLGELLKEESETRRFDNKFMGQIHPQGSRIGILGNLVAAYMNTNTIVREVSISEHGMELEVTKDLAEMFGYDSRESSGNVVTGGTTANMAALWVARQKKLKEFNDLGTEKRDRRLTVLATDMTHYSVEKACDMLGLGLVKVPKLDNFKMDINALNDMLSKMSEDDLGNVVAVIGLAGETETGLVDDFDCLADVTDDFGVYLHADAAYGGPFILSDESKYLFNGIDRADSITIDPHKMMYTPYSAGVILFKDKHDHALIQKSARYLSPDGNEGVLGDSELRNFGFGGRVEGSMGAGGVISTWATKKLLGDEGLKVLLNHTLELTRHAYDLVSESTRLRPVHKPELNTMLIGLRDSGLTKKEASKLVEEVQKVVLEKHKYYVSCNGEVDDGQSAFRFVPTHPYTTEKEVTELIGLLEMEIENYLASNK